MDEQKMVFLENGFFVPRKPSFFLSLFLVIQSLLLFYIFSPITAATPFISSFSLFYTTGAKMEEQSQVTHSHSLDKNNTTCHGHQMPPTEKKLKIGDGNNASNLTGGGGETISTSAFEKRSSSEEKRCDIFDGRWVRDEREPFYPPASCPYIDPIASCHLNGRPDYDFLHWRWKPNHCPVPRMNATDFLERLRGQRLIFVGDSLNRNMWESLVCILRHAVANKEKVFEVSGGTEFKSRPYSSIKFTDYNCTVEYVRAPYLVKQIIVFESTGKRKNRVRLDKMERASSIYSGADIMIFNTGHWWGHEKTGKNCFQVGDYVYPYLPQIEAYERGLATWGKWVDRNVDRDKTHVFFRGFSLGHFRGGKWNSGGTCHNETEPIYNDSFLEEYPPMNRMVEKTLKKMKTSVTYLNITRLTSYRKDAHPSVYRRKFDSVEDQIASMGIQDCSHWCLPGVPDAWNELLYVSLLQSGRGPWKF